MSSPSRTQMLRRRIAVEAARLISESGLRDYRQAKLKAAARLGISDEASLPRNREIEDALREHQRLFHATDQARTLRRLREVAREAMRFFARHEPRLVGAVLEGTADEHSAVCLHLYSDQPQEVIAQLLEHGIPYEEQTRRLRLDRDTARDVPALVFSADGTPVDLTLLPYDLLRQAPLDRISEKPMRRATLGALEELLASES
ncbi:MAG: hypothetical protein GXC76_08085 [Rhodanobacteraceae bacterium]|jgi:hypothetical protein|nr:hypothetical protein [Rhodanobacteraceae bacterium]